MLLVANITSDPFQQQQFVLPDGSTILFQMYYSQQQYGWFITQLTYGTFQLQGTRITCNPNILNQFQNIIPFGLACITTLNREPTQLQDFSSGDFNLYILTSAEVSEYQTFLQSGSLL